MRNSILKEHYKKIGSKGGKRLFKKRGREYMAYIGGLGGKKKIVKGVDNSLDGSK